MIFYGVCALISSITLPLSMMNSYEDPEQVRSAWLASPFVAGFGVLLIHYGRKWARSSRSSNKKKVQSIHSVSSAGSAANTFKKAYSWKSNINVVVSSVPKITETAAPTPQGPATADCPGCGAKVAVDPRQIVNCEYCGTPLTYGKT